MWGGNPTLVRPRYLCEVTTSNTSTFEMPMLTQSFFVWWDDISPIRMMSKYGSMFFYPVYPIVEWPNIIAAKVHLSSAVHRHPLDGTSEKDPHISLLKGGHRLSNIRRPDRKKNLLKSGSLSESRTIEGHFFS